MNMRQLPEITFDVAGYKFKYYPYCFRHKDPCLYYYGTEYTGTESEPTPQGMHDVDVWEPIEPGPIAYGLARREADKVVEDLKDVGRKVAFVNINPLGLRIGYQPMIMIMPTQDEIMQAMAIMAED